MNRALLASAALLLLLPVADVVAKSSDRNQAMTIDSGSQSGNMEGNGKTVLGGGVVVTQGTLEIRSAAAEIYMSDGEVSRSVFTGKQVKMKQQMDDGTWMDAQADHFARLQGQAEVGDDFALLVALAQALGGQHQFLPCAGCADLGWMTVRTRVPSPPLCMLPLLVL